MKSSRKKKAEPLSQRLKTDFQKNWLLYVMLLPVLIYLIIFCYAPMYGVIIAFKNFKPRLGILGSDWVGLKYFKEFVGSVFFGRTLKNTLMISGLNLLFGFSAPIIFAILLNEVVNMRFKKVVQTITYLPHFITTVVIASLILVFTNSDGFITQIVNSLTGHQGSLIADPHCFRAIYIISDIWQSFGWGSIVYLAAITGINPQLYEAAYRWSEQAETDLACNPSGYAADHRHHVYYGCGRSDEHWLGESLPDPVTGYIQDLRYHFHLRIP